MFPACGINTLFEFSKLGFKIHEGSGQIHYLIISNLFLVLIYALLLYFYNKKILPKVVSNSSMIAPNSLYSISVLWILLGTILLFNLLTMNTFYNRWNNGVSAMESLLEKTSEKRFVKILKKQNESLEAINTGKVNKEIVDYTQGITVAFNERFNCLQSYQDAIKKINSQK